MQKVITMRHVLKEVTKELGEEEGKKVFEWYCNVYHVNIDCYAPSTVRREVFGV